MDADINGLARGNSALAAANEQLASEIRAMRQALKDATAAAAVNRKTSKQMGGALHGRIKYERARRSAVMIGRARETAVRRCMAFERRCKQVAESMGSFRPDYVAKLEARIMDKKLEVTRLSKANEREVREGHRLEHYIRGLDERNRRIPEISQGLYRLLSKLKYQFREIETRRAQLQGESASVGGRLALRRSGSLLNILPDTEADLVAKNSKIRAELRSLGYTPKAPRGRKKARRQRSTDEKNEVKELTRKVEVRQAELGKRMAAHKAAAQRLNSEVAKARARMERMGGELDAQRKQVRMQELAVKRLRRENKQTDDGIQKLNQARSEQIAAKAKEIELEQERERRKRAAEETRRRRDEERRLEKKHAAELERAHREAAEAAAKKREDERLESIASMTVIAAEREMARQVDMGGPRMRWSSAKKKIQQRGAYGWVYRRKNGHPSQEKLSAPSLDDDAQARHASVRDLEKSLRSKFVAKVGREPSDQEWARIRSRLEGSEAQAAEAAAATPAEESATPTEIEEYKSENENETETVGSVDAPAAEEVVDDGTSRAETEEEAAVLIQSQIRRKQATEMVEEKRREVEEAEASAGRELAATKLQAEARRRQAAAKVEEMRRDAQAAEEAKAPREEASAATGDDPAVGANTSAADDGSADVQEDTAVAAAAESGVNEGTEKTQAQVPVGEKERSEAVADVAGDVEATEEGRGGTTGAEKNQDVNVSNAPAPADADATKEEKSAAAAALPSTAEENVAEGDAGDADTATESAPTEEVEADEAEAEAGQAEAGSSAGAPQNQNQEQESSTRSAAEAAIRKRFREKVGRDPTPAEWSRITSRLDAEKSVK